MSKTGLFLLSVCAGIVIGLLLGYQFFHRPAALPASLTTSHTDTSGIHQYFYRLNDTLVTIHTVSGSDTGIVHRIDTAAVAPR